MSKRFDIPLRAITKQIPTKLFEVAFKRKFHTKGVKFLDVKLPKLFEREADLVVEYEGEIYHLEIQSIDDPLMHLRMAFYYLLILSNYKKPPHQAVIYVGEKPLKRMENFIELPTFRFSYEIIDLNKLDCSVFTQSKNPYDWVIALLCKMENEKEDIKRVFERIKTLPGKPSGLPSSSKHPKSFPKGVNPRRKPPPLKLPLQVSVQREPPKGERVQNAVRSF